MSSVNSRRINFNIVITKGLQTSINATKFIVLFERPFGTRSDHILYKNVKQVYAMKQ